MPYWILTKECGNLFTILLTKMWFIHYVINGIHFVINGVYFHEMFPLNPQEIHCFH